MVFWSLAGIASMIVSGACVVLYQKHRRQKLMQRFLKRHGWQYVTEPESVSVSTQAQDGGTPNLYKIFDLFYEKHWRARYEKEFNVSPPKLAVRFEKNGECTPLRGTAWEIAAYQLDELLMLETEDVIQSPSLPVMVRRARKSKAPADR